MATVGIRGLIFVRVSFCLTILADHRVVTGLPVTSVNSTPESGVRRWSGRSSDVDDLSSRRPCFSATVSTDNITDVERDKKIVPMAGRIGCHSCHFKTTSVCCCF